FPCGLPSRDGCVEVFASPFNPPFFFFEKVFKIAPLVEQLKIPLFWVLVGAKRGQGHGGGGGGGGGGRGRQLSPFHPAQRLIELDCTHLPVLRFPKKNFAPGCPQSDELKLGRPIASPALAFVFLVQQEFTAKLPCLRQCA